VASTLQLQLSPRVRPRDLGSASATAVDGITKSATATDERAQELELARYRSRSIDVDVARNFESRSHSSANVKAQRSTEELRAIEFKVSTFEFGCRYRTGPRPRPSDTRHAYGGRTLNAHGYQRMHGTSPRACPSSSVEFRVLAGARTWPSLSLCRRCGRLVPHDLPHQHGRVGGLGQREGDAQGKVPPLAGEGRGSRGPAVAAAAV